MNLAWSVLYYMSLCLFFFVVCVIYPCWTHPFYKAKIVLRFVRIALYASLTFFELWNCCSASLISFGAWCALVFFLNKCAHASLRFIWELVKKIKKFSLASLKLFWEKKILSSCSSLRFVWANKATYEISPKVIDIQEGYNENFHEDHWTK